ncbi:MAG: hydrogen peroxide-inducible genes activator, partial [Boseongicola sp.]|nr:hydrogen peroxide-inducible genes activator [Boseongicola sp.]
MKNVTLKQMRYFEALVAQRHFGRAADVCAVSQPALSMQIRDLEEAMGMPLFERRAREVTLTAFGETVAPRIRAIVQSVDELGELVRAAGDNLAGRLRLGVIPTIAPYLLPSLLGRLSKAFTGLETHIRETLTPRLVDELAVGQLDAAILALPVSEPSFVEVPLFDEDFVLITSMTETPKTRRAEDLDHQRLLLLEEGHCFRDQALSLCNIAPGRPRDGLDGSSLSTLVQMAGAGLGVTLLPEMAVRVETRSAPVRVSRFSSPTPRRSVGMI